MFIYHTEGEISFRFCPVSLRLVSILLNAVRVEHSYSWKGRGCLSVFQLHNLNRQKNKQGVTMDLMKEYKESVTIYLIKDSCKIL